jgi:predicted site-specific integrase-resolvase
VTQRSIDTIERLRRPDRVVDPPVRETGVVVAYCRVSSHDQKADLGRQAGRVLTWC